MSAGYHYTACGLDYVYLLNGYTEREDPKHGKGVSIKDARNLHHVIARYIVTGGRQLCGQEVRFLRSMLKLSQDILARLLGQRRGSVARWEAAPHKPIPPTVDRALRLFYAVKEEGPETAMRLVDLLSGLDALERRVPTLRLEETEREWKVAA